MFDPDFNFDPQWRPTYPPIAVLGLVVLFVAMMAVATFARADIYYSDGKDCALTLNPPIPGHMVDGVGCVPFAESATRIMIYRELKCPEGTEQVLVPGGVKCARGLVDPE